MGLSNGGLSKKIVKNLSISFSRWTLIAMELHLIQSKKNLINMYLWAAIVDTLSMKIILLLVGGNHHGLRYVCFLLMLKVNLKLSTGLSGGLRTVLNELVLVGLILIGAYYLIPFLIVLLSFPFFYLIYKLLIKRA